MSERGTMLATRTLLPIESAILRAEQERLSPGCLVRLADHPPFFRCSCGARYSNPGEHPDPVEIEQGQEMTSFWVEA
jgi:hypothetical protein